MNHSTAVTSEPEPTPRISFRADASLEIGAGHIMRCLTLAQELRKQGAEVSFISRDLPGNMNQHIKSSGIAVHQLAAHAFDQPAGPDRNALWAAVDPRQDAAETSAVLNQINPDWLVVDHYAFDADWENAVRQNGKRIMVIDDLANRPHDCELLLDHNFSRKNEDYFSLTPVHTEILTGLRYALLREEFKTYRYQRRSTNKSAETRHILIQMGGVDKQNVTSDVIKTIQKLNISKDLYISVILGKGSPHENTVKNNLETLGCPYQLAVGVDNVAQIMAEADLAIGSGGGATYERLYLGLPSLLCPVADNQIEPLRKLAKEQFIDLFETVDDLTEMLPAFLEKKLEKTIPINRGTSHIAQKLIAQRYFLIKPNAFDIRRTFHWLQDPNLRKSFLMAEKPNRRSHFGYWRNLFNNTKQRAFSIYEGRSHIGNAGVKNISQESKSGEVWLYLGDSQSRGKGAGRHSLQALEALMRLRLGLRQAYLHVSESNLPAFNLYKALGYRVCKASVAGFCNNQSDGVLRMEKEL